MSLTISLLGRPHLTRSDGDAYQFRSRKSWALLAYLLLSRRPAPRAQLAELLFAEADDPARALRWNLSELRRGLGEAATLEGDPLVLRLPVGTEVDVDVLARGSWVQAVALDGLGEDLLAGMSLRGAAGFETWLLAQQRHVAGASVAILHEAALGSMSRGAPEAALGYAVRAVAADPLDEDNQALLIRLYRLVGDDEAAARQLERCTALLERELGTSPGPAILAAARERRAETVESADETTIAAFVEAGSAAVAVGAVEAGVQSLRTAIRLADGAGTDALRTSARLTLGETLIHALRGLDEEGLAALYEADEIAGGCGDRGVMARARAELGYVDYLRAHYDRAERWLTEAIELSEPSSSTRAAATTYLGLVATDRSDDTRAAALLGEAITLSRAAGDRRREAYGLAMLGRVALLRGDVRLAAEQLDASIALAESEHWLAFLPCPQALRGEVLLIEGDVDGADTVLQQAFARSCQLADPCWEGLSARALALVADARGNARGAFSLLADARVRADRLPDRYTWLDGYILDAQCTLGLRHGHPQTQEWVDALRDLSSRTGMRGLVLRSLEHGAALGHADDAAARALLGD
ncbi:BTAD domain-containing putative transcriptional regulator [Angustibacter luteus]|uniref:BTAD domain-containing putative transcriptional regulator n=1 Tax=Angustibacter luteus TaxID=658456 RepID=A0ABW1JGI3_9ACTN